MNGIKAIASLAGTVVIAGWVAYAVSAPRNVDDVMNQPMASLDGSSIGEEIKNAQTEAKREQCIRFKELAADAWERSLDNGTTDRDARKIDELDRQVQRFCN
ncbi:hypothetical protein [Pontixanthobacter sp. CEM42]|uniref:hypothetical protein n=1 Tax=Pontixanthobacter sp. CEM42 TaxID=2792077 RepID=UPI001AE02591|nr:hypothetical protein [Pontixanthobacter sp. CEM42]